MTAALNPTTRDRRLARMRAMVDVDDSRVAIQVRGVLVRAGARLLDSASVLTASSWDDSSSPQLFVADLDHDAIQLATMLRRLCGTTAVFIAHGLDQDLLRSVADIDAACVVTMPVDMRQLDVALQFAAHRHFAAVPREVNVEMALPPRVHDLLRPRERDVVSLLLQHHRVPAIAEALGIRPQTVRNHLKRIFKQTNTRSQQDLLDWLRDGTVVSGQRARVVPLRLSRRVAPSRLPASVAHEEGASQDGPSAESDEGGDASEGS